MQQGLTAYEATGGKLWTPYFLGLLADALGKAGRLDEGVVAIAKALSLAEETGEEYSLAESYRIKGELIIKTAQRTLLVHDARARLEIAPLLAEAESCFTAALTIAKQQRARSWQLRIALSLSHLKSERESTQTHLAQIYSSFSEGFETADLKRARMQIRTTAQA
jgi:predicted ATPase